MSTLNATSVVLGTGSQLFHSATAFSSTEFIAHQKSNDDMVYVNSSTGATTLASTTNTTTRGMHYFPATNELVMCNADTGTIQKLSLDTTSESLVQISTGANFQSLRGDRNNTYVFGWKRPSGVNQVYRMDADGTNEITVDVSTLHQNEDLGGFALDEDNQRVFYHGRTSRLLYSISWDLVSDFTTYSLTVGANDNADIDYAKGFVYYANIDPSTGATNNKWYQFNPSTEESIEILGVTEYTTGSGDYYSLDVFVDPNSNKLFISGASNWLQITGTDFTFFPEPLAVTTGVLTAMAVWESVASAIVYRLTYTPSGGSETIAVSTTVDLLATISGLVPETIYDFKLYSSVDGLVYDLVETLSGTTSSNIAANYDITEFGSTGSYDLSTFTTTSLASMSSVLNDLFVTDDKISVSVGGKLQVAKFIKTGETSTIEESTAVILPFDALNGSSQTVNFTYSNATTEAVDYDDVSETIQIEGAVYSPGDSFVLDGRKSTVVEL